MFQQSRTRITHSSPTVLVDTPARGMIVEARLQLVAVAAPAASLYVDYCRQDPGNAPVPAGLVYRLSALGTSLTAGSIISMFFDPAFAGFGIDPPMSGDSNLNLGFPFDLPSYAPGLYARVTCDQPTWTVDLFTMIRRKRYR